MPYLKELLKYNNKVFVETGTYLGQTTELINNECPDMSIISIDLSEVFFQDACEKFKDISNVKLYNSNSATELFSIIEPINEKITFWLDSHWSYTPNCVIDDENPCPILKELDQIKMHNLKNHTIIVDDIRLMNNSSNLFEGFPILLQDIIDKIFEINPNYKINFYDDYCSAGDILVAYIPDDKICIHNYITKCHTNPQAPGLGDFLRGTVCLHELCTKFEYKLKLSNSHPLFSYLLNNENIINEKFQVNEIICPIPYDEMQEKLSKLFLENNTFSVITHAFYTTFTKECKEYLKDILRPTEQIEIELKKLDYKNYTTIHLRFNDEFLQENYYDHSLYLSVVELLKSLPEDNYVLITNSSLMGTLLKNDIPSLNYRESSKIHLGDMSGTYNDIETGVFDTLIDLFILSRSSKIMYYNTSGFSKMISEIYDIPYSKIK